MAKLYIGSICLTDIEQKKSEGHSAFVDAKNGKEYFNINIWINDQPDKYGNTVSVQLRSTKEGRESEPNTYVGRAKSPEYKTPEPNNEDLF